MINYLEKTWRCNIIKNNIDRLVVEAIKHGIEVVAPADMSTVKTQNSKSARGWDCINTALIDTLEPEGYNIKIVDRGIWQLTPIYDGLSQELITIMREARLRTVIYEVKNKASKNYVGSLVKFFNKNEPKVMDQLSLENIAEFSDCKCIEQFTSTLGVQENDILRYRIIAFSSTNSKINDVKSITLDTNLDIIGSKCYSLVKYMNVADESVIVDNVDDFINVSNNPARNLGKNSKLRKRAASKGIDIAVTGDIKSSINEEKNEIN